MKHLIVSLLRRLQVEEALVGDLEEQHQRGRSSAWYWRQAVVAIAWHVASQAWRFRFAVAALVAVDAMLPYLYRSLLFPWVVAVDGSWQPQVLNWALRADATALHVVYGLTTGLSTQIAWCLLLASVTWVFVRVHRGAAPIIVVALIALQVGHCAPGLFHTWAVWLGDPVNVVGLLTAIRFTGFMGVAIPLSIRWAQQAVSGRAAIGVYQP